VRERTVGKLLLAKPIFLRGLALTSRIRAKLRMVICVKKPQRPEQAWRKDHQGEIEERSDQWRAGIEIAFPDNSPPARGIFAMFQMEKSLLSAKSVGKPTLYFVGVRFACEASWVFALT